MSCLIQPWFQEPDTNPILDFTVTLRTVPPWMSIYSLAWASYVHRIIITLKVEDSQSNFENFTCFLHSIVSEMQWNCLEYFFSYSLCLVWLMVKIWTEKKKLWIFGKRDASLMLRYDISELQETGGGAEMQAVEAAERNRSVSLCRVKTWPQLMCCASSRNQVS